MARARKRSALAESSAKRPLPAQWLYAQAHPRRPQAPLRGGLSSGFEPADQPALPARLAGASLLPKAGPKGQTSPTVAPLDRHLTKKGRGQR